jgi:dTDP-4-dehydrorhamnose reductase
MVKRILVVGSKGMLGYAVSEYFSREGYNVIGLRREVFDIAKDSHADLRRYLGDVDVVVNCAGVIKPTVANNSFEDILRINAIFPRNLARLCAEHGVQCFHITTDCVYSGKKGNYTESDLYDADDVYGMSKNAGETADCMVLRMSIIGEEKGQSRSLLEWARSRAGKEVNGFTNHEWNGVTTVYLAELIETIHTLNLYQKGIFHLHSPDTVSKFELLMLINKSYELRLRIAPVEATEIINRTLASRHSLSEQIATKPLSIQIEEMQRFFSSVPVAV